MAARRDLVRSAVICGGGAGGLVLAARLARRPDLKVHLVDPAPAHIWKPLLHEIASGTLDAASQEVSYLALADWRGFTFAQGRLESLDRERKTVRVSATLAPDGDEIIPARDIAYDALVLALGGATNDFGTPGVTENAQFLDSVEDAERIFNRILKAFMSANYHAGAGARQEFRVTIVGGGATGVELAAELRSAVRALSAYGLDRIDPDRFLRIAILNADPRLVPNLPEHTSATVQTKLESLGIEVFNGSTVVEVCRGAVAVKSGETQASDLTIWAAGVKGPPLLGRLDGLELNRNGQVQVSSSLQTVVDPAIFALGDCASAPWLGTPSTVPPRAQSAHQEAIFLAGAIPQFLGGREVGAFHYRDFGSLLSIGQTGAVGRLMGFVRGAGLDVEGLFARLFYRWLYLRHLAALFGWGAVVLDALGNWMRSTTRPGVKLH